MIPDKVVPQVFQAHCSQMLSLRDFNLKRDGKEENLKGAEVKRCIEVQDLKMAEAVSGNRDKMLSHQNGGMLGQTARDVSCRWNVDVTKGQPNESKQRVFTLNVLQQRSLPLSLAFWQTLKGRQRSGKASQQKKERLQLGSDWRLWHGEAVGGLNYSQKWAILCDRLEVHT